MTYRVTFEQYGRNQVETFEELPRAQRFAKSLKRTGAKNVHVRPPGLLSLLREYSPAIVGGVSIALLIKYVW